MVNITKESFEVTLKSLIEANAHAKSKGDDFKNWCKENFDCDARISYIKAQQQLTNRVSEQFRYFSPVVVFVCVEEVNRDTLLKYIMERTYSEMENVAVVGLTQTESGEYHYKYEHLVVLKNTSFTEWATPLFENVKTGKELKKELGIPGDLDFGWYVGATGHNGEGEWCDFSDEYVEQGIWINGWDDKFIDIVKDIKIGDRIAIKSVFNQKNNIPFENHGKKVAVMRIKAIGTVTENAGDGKNIKVDWTKLNPEKDWYGPGNLRQTIHGVSAEDGEIKKQLLAFTFGKDPQDYALCEEYYADEFETHEEELTPDLFDDNVKQEEPVKKVSCLDIKRSERTNKVYPLNFIVFGAPGTGKTYSMVEYALSIVDGRVADFSKVDAEERKARVDRYKQLIKDGQIVFTTFHQNYGYEEFIQGLRPDTKSPTMAFKTVDGVFKQIADRALADTSGNNYVIIIDEINRANISKVFGELITLIEDDKRWGELNEMCVTLQSGDVFAVPNNLYIVGTMNSADKSISLIDAALRRRFSFKEQLPDATLVDDPIMRSVLEKLNLKLVDELESTDLLIGHSYFMNKGEADLCDVLNNNIIPLLYEYFYDNKKKVAAVLQDTITKSGATIELVDEKIGRLKVKLKGDTDGAE